jgi:protein ImuB
MKRILCLRIPHLPLQRLVASKPELRQASATRPVLLVHNSGRTGETVAFCSQRAWQQGVRPGMPVAEALSLFPQPQSVTLAPHQPDEDRQWLARIAAWCERYSPLVGWQTISGPQQKWLYTEPEPTALFLDITGIGPLFGDEQGLAQTLFTRLARQRVSVRLGIAETIGAAWANTWAAMGDLSPQAKPIFLIPCGLLEPALAPLPVQALRLPAGIVDTLEQLGVTIIGQILQLPRAGLASRFGPPLLVRLEQALGEAAELIEPYRPLPPFQVDWPLEEPIACQLTIAAILKELAARLAAQLQAKQLGATELTCRLDGAGHPPLSLEIGLYRPTAEAAHWEELLRLRSEQLRLRGPIGRISLAAASTAPLAVRQTSLFGDHQSQTSQVVLLFNRLSSRLGPEAVVRPQLMADPVPEQSVRWVPAVNDRQRVTNGHKLLGFAPGHRPLVLLPEPEPLHALSLFDEGAPARFHYEGQAHLVAQHWGPERLETGWWRGRRVRRDYYRVETSEGTRYWLFRDLTNGQWFLHGLFE